MEPSFAYLQTRTLIVGLIRFSVQRTEDPLAYNDDVRRRLYMELLRNQPNVLYCLVQSSRTTKTTTAFDKVSVIYSFSIS